MKTFWELREVSSSVAKKALKKRVEKQAAAYTTSGAHHRRAQIARNKRDALLRKADALPDHHKPRSSGGDYFKGSPEHEKLKKQAQHHNATAGYHAHKSREAQQKADNMSKKIDRSQMKAYPKLAKHAGTRRGDAASIKHVDRMRDKHFATTTQARGGYDYRDPSKEKLRGKQHSQYPKRKNESVTEQIIAEISNKTLDAYRKKAIKSYNKSIDYMHRPSEKRPETKAKHQKNLDKRLKGIDSTYKRDMAGKPEKQRFIHKPTRHDEIESGKRGLTNKPASKLAKAYKDR